MTTYKAGVTTGRKSSRRSFCKRSEECARISTFVSKIVEAEIVAHQGTEGIPEVPESAQHRYTDDDPDGFPAIETVDVGSAPVLRSTWSRGKVCRSRTSLGHRHSCVPTSRPRLHRLGSTPLTVAPGAEIMTTPVRSPFSAPILRPRYIRTPDRGEGPPLPRPARGCCTSDRADRNPLTRSKQVFGRWGRRPLVMGRRPLHTPRYRQGSGPASRLRDPCRSIDTSRSSV